MLGLLEIEDEPEVGSVSAKQLKAVQRPEQSIRSVVGKVGIGAGHTMTSGTSGRQPSSATPHSLARCDLGL